MLGIHIAAILTTAVIVMLFWLKFIKGKQAVDSRSLWLAALITLPLQPLAYYLVRLPLDAWLSAHLDKNGLTYSALKTLYAPVTEETAKLIPLLVPFISREIRPQNFAQYAWAIGMSFAVGEVWFVAVKISEVPRFAALPFYDFAGFFSERLMTCVFHSAFVAITLWKLRNRTLLGLAAAMAFHWAGNFPIFLMSWNAGALEPNTYSFLIQLHLLLLLLIAGGLLVWFGQGINIFYGRRECPECSGQYEPPLLAINLGRKRYERCPHCQRWHWTNPLKT
jgi:hypothetical protein